MWADGTDWINQDSSGERKQHKAVPGWMRIQWARTTGLLAACWGMNTGCRMGCHDATREGVWQGQHSSPMGLGHWCTEKR